MSSAKPRSGNTRLSIGSPALLHFKTAAHHHAFSGFHVLHMQTRIGKE